MTAVALRARAIDIVAGSHPLVRALSFDLNAGEMLAVLGRNGSGKSLLLHTLAGLRAASAGAIELQGSSLTALSRREIAQRLGILPQDSEPPTHTPVLEWVLGGRYAHGREWRWPSEADRQIALQSLRRVELETLAARWLTTLSGGELRRAALATLLTQNPAVMLLDEPTNHLDPRQIATTMRIAREACAAGGAVVVTLHDPQLALRWADKALLLHGDGRWQIGAADSVLSAATLTALYDTPYVSLAVDGKRLLMAQ